MTASLIAELENLTALLNGSQPEKAVLLARRLIARNPQAPILHMLLGVGLTNSGKLDPAVHSYKKALSLKPDYVEAFNYLALTLQRQGKLAEAEAAYTNVLKLQPGHGEASQNLGAILEDEAKAAIAARRSADAVELMTRLAALRPADPMTLANLASTLNTRGRFAETAPVIQRALAIEPENIRFLAIAAKAERARGLPFEPLLHRIVAAPEREPRDARMKMCAALTLDLPEEAFALRPEGLNVMGFADLGRFYRSDLAARLQTLPPLTGALPAKNQRPLLFASGDGLYAKMFARDLIGSALENVPGCDFHLHIINPGSFEAEKAFAGFPVGRVTWSAEEAAPDKTLYSTRRFIRMAQILRTVERTIIALDIDSIIKGDIVAALPARFDVVIYDRPDEIFANQMVNAGFLAVAPGGQDFADFMAGYILHFEGQGAAQWFVDQMAIIAARAWLRRNVPDMSIQSAPSHMMDWQDDHAPGSLIWHFKGALKNEIAR